MWGIPYVPLCDNDTEVANTYREAIPSPETGILLPMIRAIVRAHALRTNITQDGYSVSLHIDAK